MNYDILQISSILNACVHGNSNPMIEWIITDSRMVTFPETTLFFAISSSYKDAQQYIEELYEKGGRAFVIERWEESYAIDFPEAAFLVVHHTLQALQYLAAHHRAAYSFPVIGITGSNGKTIVKEWLYQLLSPSFNVTRSPRSYNSQVGVPLSIALLNDKTEVAVIEAGISQRGEMTTLQKIIQPTIGVFTHIGEAHQEFFHSLMEKIEEKLQLFSEVSFFVYDADQPLLHTAIVRCGLEEKAFGWSQQDKEKALYISQITKNDFSTDIDYQYQGVSARYTLPFTDDASIENSLHCLAVCLQLGLSVDMIANRMQKLEAVAMRLEVKQGIRGCTIINDSYNNDITSLEIALNFMERRTAPLEMSRTLILSDILQSGIPEEMLCHEVASLLACYRIDNVITIGEMMGKMASLLPEKVHFHSFLSTDELLNSHLLNSISQSIILIKGARVFSFEQIVERLSLRLHETVLEVDLDAVAENLKYYRSFLRPETKMVGMIKASAYGSGAIEIGKTLEDRRIDYLAVAVADEGVELRKAGIKCPIIVMNPEFSSFDLLFQHHLEPEVYSFHLLYALREAAKKAGITNFPIHIKLDTGMSRLGFQPEQEVESLIAYLQSQKALMPRSVFSHFVGSDSAEFDDFSKEQFRCFDAASQKIQQGFSHKILRHICNTAAIERFPDWQLDMVRVGLGLYGISSIDNRILNNVTTLKTTILQIHEVEANTTVGYSRRGKLSRPSRIAAIPIGYADGLNRHLGNGRGECWINGKRAPYVGNICMDVCMIDVTDIVCKEGDSVEIFGNHLLVTEVSDLLQTIPYEVLTNISERVKRVYLQ